MPHIGVLFEVRRAETRPGETIGVVGNRQELGSWDPFDSKSDAGMHLRTGAKQYPTWAMPAPVWIQLGKETLDGPEDDVGSSDQDSEASQASTPDSPEGMSGRNGDVAGCQHIHSGSTLAGSEASIRIEYKYVRDCRQVHAGGPSIQWEDSIANRRVVLPQEHGSIWIVSDVRFNDTSEPTVKRTTLAEVLERRGNLDPEWTNLRKESRQHDAPEWAGSQQEEASTPGSAATSHHTTSTVCFL